MLKQYACIQSSKLLIKAFFQWQKRDSGYLWFVKSHCFPEMGVELGELHRLEFLGEEEEALKQVLLLLLERGVFDLDFCKLSSAPKLDLHFRKQRLQQNSETQCLTIEASKSF